jgi:hypothetical protein
MTKIEVDGADLVIEVQGIDIVLALKHHVRVPLANIERYGPGAGEADARPSLRLGGTSLPGFRAGTFLEDGKLSFWDAVDFDKTIALYVRDFVYAKIVVQVDDVSDALHLIARALP